jgi:hypothetical protein
MKKQQRHQDSVDPHDDASAEPIAPLTREEWTAAHADALAVLKTLKQAEPRDADAVLQQKFVVQGLAAQLAALTEDESTQ